ncbi:MAG: alpha/beta hydrolase [Gammaproteobacteria bacterium]|nr:MAG: alpha/beta hydrolase [Gammaproteobacteria bacterium]
MPLTQQDLQDLSKLLPKLEFSPVKDCDWQNAPLVQHYLNHYGINFVKQYEQLTHGFGYVDAAAFKIATHYWLPANPQGTLVLMHGYYDHVGIFGHPIRFAIEHNLAVLAFDLPGHGLSSGEPAVINSFNQYGDVVAEILQQSAVIMPQTLYAIGQSTGCAALLNYLWRHVVAKNGTDPFKKLVLCSPLVLPRAWRGRHMGRHVYAVVRHFAQRISRKFSNNSHDPVFLDFIHHQDPLQARHLSLQWIGAMKAWHELFLTLSPLQKNVLIVQGTEDMTVDWNYNLSLIKRKLPNAEIVYLEGAAHQLVNESENYRRDLFAAIEKYFFN